MKKFATLFLVCLLAAVSGMAQTIRSGNVFWDGHTRYVATVLQNGEVRLQGTSADGDTYTVGLRKNGTAQGEYKLVQVSEDEGAPYGCLFGSRVQYVRRDGMTFLAFYPEEGTIGQVAVLTPDNLEALTAQQQFMETETDDETAPSDFLFNLRYVGQQTAQTLDRWIEILSAKKTKTLIERTNQQIIAYALAVGNYNRDGEGGDMIVVENEEQFLEALGPERVIVIAEGVQLNLSKVLNEQYRFIGRPNYRWSDDATAGTSQDYEIVSETVFDGRQLTLKNVNNLTIEGQKGASIVVEPRYAFCINLINCGGCAINNLTIGHTQGGYCEGGVIGINGGGGTVVRNCDLYGCGTYGFEIADTRGLTVMESIVRDCSYGILTARSSIEIDFLTCAFLRNREFSLIEVTGCDGVSFNHCLFKDNYDKVALFNTDSDITLRACEIFHPQENIGTVEMLVMPDNDCLFSSNGGTPTLDINNIGPKKE